VIEAGRLTVTSIAVCNRRRRVGFRHAVSDRRCLAVQYVAKGQQAKITHASLDHLVGGGKQRRWDG